MSEVVKEKRWYINTNAPSGITYAVEHADKNAVWQDVLTVDLETFASGGTSEAPPELIAWLNDPPGEWVEEEVAPSSFRRRVAGGWILDIASPVPEGARIHMFVPVAGASGITVLYDLEEMLGEGDSDAKSD